jgi:hypothetical protein
MQAAVYLQDRKVISLQQPQQQTPQHRHGFSWNGTCKLCACCSSSNPLKPLRLLQANIGQLI